MKHAKCNNGQLLSLNKGSLCMLFFRLSIDNIEAELHSLSAKTRSLKDNIRQDPELFQQMEGFIQVCRTSLLMCYCHFNAAVFLSLT